MYHVVDRGRNADRPHFFNLSRFRGSKGIYPFVDLYGIALRYKDKGTGFLCAFSNTLFQTYINGLVWYGFVCKGTVKGYRCHSCSYKNRHFRRCISVATITHVNYRSVIDFPWLRVSGIRSRIPGFRTTCYEGYVETFLSYIFYPGDHCRNNTFVRYTV